MGDSWWVDTSRTSNSGKRRSKPHIAYDGRRIVKVRRLTDLPVAEGDEVFIDVMFPEILNNLIELLRKGVKVYLLRNPRFVKEFRKRFGLKKTDVNDAKVLSEIPKEVFKELTLNEVEVRRRLQPLLEQYEVISKRLKTVKQWINDWKRKGYEFDGLKTFKKELIRMRDRLKRRIIKVARDELKMYRLVEGELGFGGVRLVDLLLYIDLSQGIQKIKNRAWGSRRARESLARLALAIYFNAKRGVNKQNKYTRIAIKTEDRKEALNRIKREILRDLRRLWRRYYGGG